VRRTHGGVAAVGAGDLGVADEQVSVLAVEDADGARGHVEARPLPVADEVGLLDLGLTEVVQLLGRHRLVDGAGVLLAQGAGG
jgi:hypothetical protein